MRTWRFLPLVLGIGLGAIILAAYAAGQNDPMEDGEGITTPYGHLRHVCLFKFPENAAQDQIDAVIERLQELPKHIEVIEAFEWGKEMSGRGLNEGFTYAAIFTFKNEADRDAYLVHPFHKKASEFVGGVVEQVLIFDYWATP